MISIGKFNDKEDLVERRIIHKDVARPVFSKSMGRGIRNAFGKRNWAFFEMYGRMYQMNKIGKPITKEHRQNYKKALNRIYKGVDNKWIKGEMKNVARKLNKFLRNIERDYSDDENFYEDGPVKFKRTDLNKLQKYSVNFITLIETLCDEAEITTYLSPISGVKGEWYKVKEGRSDRKETGDEQMARAEKLDEANNELFSNFIYRKLRKAFKRKGRKYFEMYPKLYLFYKGDIELNTDDLQGFYEAYKFLAKRVIDDEIIKENLHKHSKDLRKKFRRFLRKDNVNERKIRDVKKSFLDMMERLMAEKDIYVKRKKVERYWFKLNKARPSQEKLQKARQENPEYQEMKDKEKEIYSQSKENIKKQIRRDGLEVEETVIEGKPVLKGTDPASGEEYIYDVIQIEQTEEGEFDWDISGEPKPVDEWLSDRYEFFEQQEKLANWRLQSTDLDKLRVYDDDQVTEAMLEQDEDYTAISDDNKKHNPLTRVVPTVEINGERVITEGRFKGIPVESMINDMGRMIEGGGTTIDSQGNEVKIEQKDEEGNLEVEGYTEPYVTVADDGSFYIGVSGASGDWTNIRGELNDMAGNLEWVEKIDNRNRTEFKFEPEVFGEIKDLMPGGMLMSEAATEKIKKYHKERKVREEVMTDERLERFNTENLGGFKEDIDLYGKQKEALAFLDQNDDQGVLAMSTGTGKTASSMAHIRKLVNDGVMGDNDKVLWVAPAKIVGNFREQVGKMMEKPLDIKVGPVNEVNDPNEYDADALSYTKFQGLDSGQYDADDEVLKGDEWSMDEYEAVYFDEAHKNLTNTKNATSRAAQKDHPRKVMLTASPINKSPKEAYALSKIANNVKMHRNDRRKEMRDFLDVYCEDVAGRKVALSERETRRKGFLSWVKENMFYADKTNIDEYDLPGKKKTSKSITMGDKVTSQYKDLLKEFKKEYGEVSKKLDSLTRELKKEDADPEEIEAKKTDFVMEFAGQSQVNELMKKIRMLQNRPDELIEGAENPKLQQCIDELGDQDSLERTVVFCQYTDTAQYYAKNISKEVPGKKVAAGLASKARVEFWKDGQLQETMNETQKMSSVDILEDHVKDANAEEIIEVCVLMDSYAQGLNLQTFHNVVHVDRDDWKNEQLKQRSARVWRNGQDEEVSETFLDASIPEDKQTDYARDTVDELMSHMNGIQEDMFQDMIEASQEEDIQTGFGDVEFKRASYYGMDKRLAKLEMSPYIEDQVDLKESLGDDNVNTSDDALIQAKNEAQRGE